MSQLQISPYDRPNVAAGNLLTGNLRGAATALVAPKELGPSEQTSLSDRLMGGLKQIDNPVLRGIMSIATDPFVILGLFLSSRYPIMAADKLFKYGKKFAGYAHKIGPIEGLVGRAERFFANTGIPDLMLRHAQQRAAFHEKWIGKLNKITADFKKKYKRVPTDKEFRMAAVKLDRVDSKGLYFEPIGFRTKPLVAEKIKLTPQEKMLYDKMRGDFLPGYFDEVIKPQYGKGSKEGKRFLRSSMSQGGVGGLGPDYYPHTVKRTPSIERDYAISQSIQADWSDKQLGREITNLMKNKAPRAHAIHRQGILTPDLDELRALGLPIDETAVAQMQSGMEEMSKWAIDNVMKGTDKLLGAKGTVLEKVNNIKKLMLRRGIPVGNQREAFDILGETVSAGKMNQAKDIVRRMTAQGTMQRTYSFDLMKVMENYVHSGTHPFVWNVEKIPDELATRWNIRKGASLGDAIVTEKSRLLQPSGAAILEQDYFPILKGRLTESQVSSMLRWSNVKLKAVESIDEGILGKWLPKNVGKGLKDMLLSEKGPLSYLNTNAKVASWFYYSALGFNPSSAIQNLAQPLITTMPATGFKAMWDGIKETTARISKYYSLRAQHMGADDAFQAAFPEFAKSHLAAAPVERAVLDEALSSAYAGAQDTVLARAASGGAGTIDKLKKAAMFLFGKSEKFNRVASYYAGRSKAIADGLKGSAVDEFATKLVRATQFPAGPGQMPRGLLKLSAPWRQFMYFPTRYLGFLAESTLYGGKNVRDWGTIARAGMYSAAAAKGAKEMLGADISRSLMFGAMPMPDYENAPFFPFPFVPPIAGVLGAGVESLATQSLRPLQQTSSILVPGGVAARRLYKTFSPKYAKYDQRTADGKIPVHGENGGLIRNYTPWELVMQGVGIKPVGKAEEQDTVGYLLRHRDKLRDYRRSYVEALLNGNPEEAQRINAEFQQVYKMGPIELKKSDLRAAQDRRLMTRVQRVLKTMPKAYRPQFAEAANAAMASQTGNLFSPINEPQPWATQQSLGFGQPLSPGFQFSAGAGGFGVPNTESGFGF